jgi:hypothetical protein
MSAYVVHPDTINLIAAAGYRLNVSVYLRAETERRPADFDGVYQNRLHGKTDVRDIAATLHAENVHSVNVRYSESDAPDGFTFEHIDLDRVERLMGQPWAVVVLGSIRCLRYQSCESSDYEASAGALILDTIERAVIAEITKNAPWGWTRDSKSEAA